MIAVQALLRLRNHLPSLEYISRQNSLSQDARLLLDKCLDLQRGMQAPSFTELEDYALNLSNLLLESCSREIVPNLSYTTRLKLSLIVWHFNASSSESSSELLAFFSSRSPFDKKVCETLHVRYQNHICQTVTFDDFRCSFDFLLIPDGCFD